MTITCNLYTNGQWHDAEGQATFTRDNPLTHERASVASAASLADARRCAAAAGAPAGARYGTRRAPTSPAGGRGRDAAP